VKTALNLGVGLVRVGIVVAGLRTGVIGVAVGGSVGVAVGAAINEKQKNLSLCFVINAPLEKRFQKHPP
jgi:hypothetical protein